MIVLDGATRAPAAPYEFTGPYAGCFADDNGAAMDKRHIYLLHDILTSRKWANAIEIGSYNGASSTALVEAFKAGTVAQATFCEVSVRPSLLEVLKSVPSEKVRLTRTPSWQVLDVGEDFDFIFLDASHDLDSVTLETKKLLRRRPLCLMAHDTSATAAGFSHCEGAAYLAQQFRDQPDYFCIEDNKKRQGELTERGLFLATTSEEVHAIAKEVFERWA